MSNGDSFRQGLSFAFRLSTEMTVATLIGASMGYALDYFFGTDPWFLAAGVLCGGAAGALGVYRTATVLTEDGEEQTGNQKDSKIKKPNGNDRRL